MKNNELNYLGGAECRAGEEPTAEHASTNDIDIGDNYDPLAERKHKEGGYSQSVGKSSPTSPAFPRSKY